MDGTRTHSAGSTPRWDNLAHHDDEELERLVRTGAAALAAATCRWLELLAEAVARGIWAERGASSPSQWLSWAVGLAPSTAREHVRVGAALRELPAVRDRFAAGTISYSKVRAITRVATPATEQLLLGWADAAPAHVLERIVRDTQRVVRTAGSAADRDDLGLTRRWRDDGTLEVRLRVDGAAGIALDQHLDWLLDTDTPDEHDDGDSGTAHHDVPRRVRAADHVVAAVADAAARTGADTSGEDRHLVVAHVAAAALDPGGASAGAAVPVRDNRGRVRVLSRTWLRRLVCAAGVDVAVDRPGGHPADLGRAARRPDAALRRAARRRDRTCRFPGCAAVRWLVLHHVDWWSRGGATDLDNLVLLCSAHHRTVHDRGWTLRLAGRGRWTFHPPGDTAGRRPLPHTEPLGASAEAPPPLRALLTAAAVHAGDMAPGALQPPHWDGWYDHHDAVGVLTDAVALAV